MFVAVVAVVAVVVPALPSGNPRPRLAPLLPDPSPQTD